MKVDMNVALKELDGSAITEKNKAGVEVPVTLREICVRALTTPLPNIDTAMDGEAAFKRLELARKVNAGGEIELDPGDAVTIRDRAAKMYGIVVSGQVYELLR